MCGRYGFTSPREQSTLDLIGATRGAVSPAAEALRVPRFNIAPSQPVLAARTRVRDGRAERHLKRGARRLTVSPTPSCRTRRSSYGTSIWAARDGP